MSSFAWGAQAIVNSMLSTAGTGLPVFYRALNSVDIETGELLDEATQLGFVQTVALSAQTGTTDIQVYPQPRVKNVSMRDIANSGGKLNETSRYFVISNDFVVQMMTKFGLTDPETVFDGNPYFQGLFYCGALYNVQQYSHSEVSGVTVSWRLTCNAVKIPLT